MEIIVKYFVGHPDQSAWDAAVQLRKRLLAEGFGGDNFRRMKALAREAAADSSGSAQRDNAAGDAAADLCRRVWFNNAR